MRLRKKI